MKDEKLYKISLAVSVVGLVALFVATHVSNPEEISIGDIDHGEAGNRVEIHGEVYRKHVSQDGHLFFHVKENGEEISAVIFKDSLDTMDLNPDLLRDGEEVTIQGDIDIYRGDLQIQPIKVTIH